MKNAIDELIGRLVTAKEIISESDAISIEIPKTKDQRKKG